MYITNSQTDKQSQKQIEKQTNRVTNRQTFRAHDTECNYSKSSSSETSQAIRVAVAQSSRDQIQFHSSRGQSGEFISRGRRATTFTD